ncbi:serine/threonine protein kinase [Nocardioides sp. GY 10113]|uniref:serine/threonine protein kinase n=1 Tax=Nocardioides sp. GY 10113 TaxID=2569761 RepID=UPI0010A82695|nr:serine/threonine-protein kinase [Nocardioides sp. GY 10113]TIC88012.1 serine/threonine protein kinase [Nocardioides sp. GY 10113]
MTSPPRPAAPTQVGDYTLLTPLGEGGMGIVHLARGSDGRRVALKVLRPHVVGDHEARARLAREVSSLARVRSDWVAEILAADPWGEVPYVVTRYVPGLSLHDHVLEEGPVSGRDLYWLAGCLAEGIAAVHAAGVLHRDVKPANVLMEGRTPILIDFGLARVADDPRLTHTGWLMGTPGYLAPEILYGDDATAAADVHAWAATVAYAALGRAPYGRGPAMAILDRVRRGEHDLAGIERPMADVLAAALSPEPLERPLLDELLAWLRPLSTRPDAPVAAPPTGGVLGTSGDDFTYPLAAVPPPEDRARSMPGPAPVEPTWGATPTVAEYGEPVPAPAVPPAPAPHTRAFEAPPPVDWTPEQAGALDQLEQQWDADYLEPTFAPAPPVPFGERFRRGVGVCAGGLVVGAGFAAAPWVTLLAVAATVWLLRAGSLASSAVADRRALRGRRWYDGLRWAFSSPWHLLRATTGTLILTVWSAGLALATGLLCYAAALDLPTSLLLSGATLGVALWSGPASLRFRAPVGRMLYPITRSWFGTAALAAGCVVIAVVLMVLAAGQGISWSPAGEGPFGIG